tara:strand:- start:45 stop:635 length:591 start_codon:yes stop_codon:yes gene_type:complete
MIKHKGDNIMSNTKTTINDIANVILLDTPDTLFNDVDNYLIDRPLNADGSKRQSTQQGERMENPKYNLDLFLIYGGMAVSCAYSLNSAKQYLDKTQHTYNQDVERFSEDEVRGTYVETAYTVAQDKYDLCHQLYTQFTSLFSSVMGYDWGVENGKVQPNYGIEWFQAKKAYKLHKDTMPTQTKKKVTAKDKALAKS